VSARFVAGELDVQRDGMYEMGIMGA